MNLIETAKNYIELGYSVLPITERKQPAVSSWAEYQARRPIISEISRALESAHGIALICGRVSGNLELLDIDCKYDITKTLLKDFCAVIEERQPGLLQKMVVAKTVNNGFHFLYRIPAYLVEGNKKLAQRPATKAEAEKGDRVKVLFETRGEGGYFAVEPTPGYEIRRGSPANVQMITEAERDALFTVARSFDEMPVESEPAEIEVIKQKTVSDGQSPFEEYNERGDVPALLEKHGWKRKRTSGSRIHFKRPGETDSPIAANFDTRRRIFYVFSTSTVFEAERGYNPTQVFAILEHNGDYSAASKDLFGQGYGRKERKIKIDYVERKPQTSGLYQWYKKFQQHKGAI